MVTAACNLISILATWGFMAYGGLPGLAWYVKPVAVVWAVSPFFALNLLAWRWLRFRARATLLLAAAIMCNVTLQAHYGMFIDRPTRDAPFLALILPFFEYLALLPFLIAGFVFEHPSED